VIAATVVGLLALAGLAYVLAPVRAGAARDSVPDGLAEDALARKASALDALMDMEAERASGKLSAEDYAALRSEYEEEAINALDDLDAFARSDDELEAEIDAMRRRLTCPECGTFRLQGEPCPRCGS
jgi:rubrerythrin